MTAAAVTRQPIRLQPEDLLDVLQPRVLLPALLLTVGFGLGCLYAGAGRWMLLAVVAGGCVAAVTRVQVSSLSFLQETGRNIIGMSANNRNDIFFIWIGFSFFQCKSNNSRMKVKKLLYFFKTVCSSSIIFCKTSAR